MSKYTLIIDSSRQMAQLREDKHILKEYIVSTASNGLGCTEGSMCTPTGKLRIAQKIGAGLPLGAVIKARIPSGDIWTNSSLNPLSQSNDDLVLSRLLWLEGIELQNANTLHRYIYLHGTNQEHLLGTPASHGCIRFSNSDIIEIYDLLEEGDLVEIP